MPTLYISDLDGTLLNSDAKLSSRSLTLLNEMLDGGLAFTIASARSVVSMRTMLDGLRLTLPVIEFNGAFISDLASGRHEIVNAIDPEIARSIHGMAAAAGLAPFVSTFDGRDDNVYYGYTINEGMQWYLDDRIANRDTRWRHGDGLGTAFDEQVICLTFIAEKTQLSEIELTISSLFCGAVETHLMENMYCPGWFWLTVHDHRATKDRAIRTLVETYGLAGREIVAFGDQINDIKMFRAAHRSFAVGNAADDLKRHSTEVIESNDADSVVEFIRRDWRK